MLTKLVEYGCKLDEKMKAMLNEIKENIQGTNSDGKETRTQISGLGQNEEINTQPELNEETRIQKKKNEERLRNLRDNFKYSNIQIIGMPEGEEEEQEIENLLEQIMKNVPNRAKEIDFQELQEAQGLPKKLDPRWNTARHMIITIDNNKDKERILKAAREKETLTYKGV